MLYSFLFGGLGGGLFLFAVLDDPKQDEPSDGDQDQRGQGLHQPEQGVLAEADEAADAAAEGAAEALSVLDDLLRRFPSHARKPDAPFWKGELLRSAGEFGPAVAALRAALDAKPSDAIARDARFALAVSLQSDGKEDEAAALFQTLLDDRSAAARFTSGQFAWLAERQIERGDLPRAAATARRMAEAAETDEWRQTAWTLAGRAERAAGHAREAEECYRRACDLPVLTRYAPEATLRLAELLLARGDAEGAEPLFRLAV